MRLTLLELAGAVAVLHGISEWSTAAAWVVGGLAAIFVAVIRGG